MKTIKRNRVKKTKIVHDDKIDIQPEEGSIPEPEWKESKGTGLKNKFCKLCLKRNSCVISSIAMVMTCNKIEIKKKRVRG